MVVTITNIYSNYLFCPQNMHEEMFVYSIIVTECLHNIILRGYDDTDTN